MKLSINHPSPSYWKWIGALKPSPYIISYQRSLSLAAIPYSWLHRLWYQRCCFRIMLCKIKCSGKWKQLWQQGIFTSLNYWTIIWTVLIGCQKEWERQLYYFYYSIIECFGIKVSFTGHLVQPHKLTWIPIVALEFISLTLSCLVV